MLKKLLNTPSLTLLTATTLIFLIIHLFTLSTDFTYPTSYMGEDLYVLDQLKTTNFDPIFFSAPAYYLVLSALSPFTSLYHPLLAHRLLSIFSLLAIATLIYQYLKLSFNRSTATLGYIITLILPVTIFLSHYSTSITLGLALSLFSLYLAHPDTPKPKYYHFLLPLTLQVLATLINIYIFPISFYFFYLSLTYREQLSAHATQFGYFGIIFPLLAGSYQYTYVPLSLYQVQNSFTPSTFLNLFSWPVLIIAFIGTLSSALFLYHNRHKLFTILLYHHKKHTLKTKLASFVNKITHHHAHHYADAGLDLLVFFLLATTSFLIAPSIYAKVVILFPLVVGLFLLGLMQISSPKLRALLMLALLPFTFHAWQNTQHYELSKINANFDQMRNMYMDINLYSTLMPKALSGYTGKNINYLSGKAYLDSAVILTLENHSSYLQSDQPTYLQAQARQIATQIPDKNKIQTFTDPNQSLPYDITDTYQLYLTLNLKPR